MTRTIQDTCNHAPVRSCDVQDVFVHFPKKQGVLSPGPIWSTFVRGPDHVPRDVVEFALRKLGNGTTRDVVYMTDPVGNVLYSADQVYTGDEAKEVLRKFRHASSVFLYLRLHGVTP